MGKYYQIFNLSKTSNNMRITICHYCGLSSQKYTAGKDFNEHLLKHKKLQFNCNQCSPGNRENWSRPAGNSEQVVEATHAAFDKFWKKYLVADLESEIHGDRLLQCVIDFNSSNI